MSLTIGENTVNIEIASERRAAYHHGDLREALLGAGMALLERQAAEPPGLREVARAVGVSASAVYRHFPDKGALLRAIAARGFTLMADMQIAASADRQGSAAFAAVGAAYVRFALAHPAVFRLMFSSAPPRDLLCADIATLDGPMRLLRTHVAGLSPVDASDGAQRVTATRAWALVHGLALLALDRIIDVDDTLIDAVLAPNIKD